MKMVTTKSDAREIISSWKRQGKRIGLVPTMGYFHQGHISLMEISKECADKTVVSIFVNPTQFGPQEDFEQYPRDLDRDMKLAEKAGVDLIFAPDISQMYPEPTKTWVTVEGLTQNLCGSSRPGHFKGVATVVTKLFNILQPDVAVFGQKDFQQFQVIKRMTLDLNMPVEIVMAPIVREQDGLAMSSRNTYLSREERKSALCLYKSLELARELILDKGERTVESIRKQMVSLINAFPFTKIDYIFIGNPETLEEPGSGHLSLPVLVALAVFVGRTRLIDNTLIEMPA